MRQPERLGLRERRREVGLARMFGFFEPRFWETLAKHLRGWRWIA
jgi:hypothetical protein